MSKVIIEKIEEEKLKEMGVKSWPVWSKEVSRFDWTYTGNEECYITEGEFVVETEEGIFEVRASDFVTFQDGLKCVWDIRKSVKKHYNFS